MKITVHGNKVTGTYWIRLTARNGKTIMVSEMYSTLTNARRAGRNLSKSLSLPLEPDVQYV